MMDLATALEIYLFEHPEWVPVAKLCEHFGIEERDLRAHGRKRPIHAGFAISSARRGEHGLKHIRHATTAERIEAKQAIKKRIIAGARALRDFHRALDTIRAGRWPKNLVDGAGNGVLPV